MRHPESLWIEFCVRRQTLLAEAERARLARRLDGSCEVHRLSLRHVLEALWRGAIRTASPYSTEESLNAPR
jgi:hypothetical protein